MDDDLFDSSTLSGRLMWCFFVGFLVAGLPVVFTLFTDGGGPVDQNGVTIRTSGESWGAILGFAVWVISSIAVLMHWVFVKEHRDAHGYYEGYGPGAHLDPPE